MAMMPGPARQADNDIYTALVFAAFLCLLASILYIGWRAVTQLGTLLPPPGV